MNLLKQIFAIKGIRPHFLMKILFLLLIAILAMPFGRILAYSQNVETQASQPPGEEVTPDKWPKTADVGGAKYTIYQPQLDSWDGYNLAGHAAVSVLPAGAKDPVFGSISATALTQVNKLLRVVDFTDLKIVRAIFPSIPGKAAQYQQGFQAMVSKMALNISLDRLQASLAALGAEKKARLVPVKNEPPKFVFSETAAVLVSIDGDPVWRPVQGTSLERVINTRALVLRDPSGNVYIHLFDGFVQASTLSESWKMASSVPPGANEAAQKLAKDRVVDLMEGPPDEKDPNKKPSLQSGVPRIVVATTPTELIVTKGEPDWAPIEGGTSLLYVENTTGNIFKDISSQQTYVLVTGRWFSAPDFEGPWQYVAGKDLPPDFAKIPDESPKENVKASVPGTPQAQEAVISNEIPHMASVDRSKAKFAPLVNGAPELRPIPDTPMNYVFNSPEPIIQVSPTEWYAVQNGVWFTAPSLQSGPWVVATSVPAVIYSIPPSSPLYYLTYVKIYNTTPKYVVVGYTPGYMGTVVAADGVVVYGTGYTYVAYIGPTVWYGPPVTYGYAANPTWTPWTGWVVGFGFGWAMGAMASSGGCWGYAPAPYWGAMPYSPYHGYAYGPYGGAAAWGPGGWAATTGNVYQHWGSTTAVTRTSAGYNAWTGNAWSSKVGASYNSATGRVSAGQKASVGNVYTGNYAYGERGATYNPTTGVSAKGGSATVGNAYTGSQTTAKYAQATGPGGQTAGVAKVGNNMYADHDGNVYKNTGSGWEKHDNGSWNSVQDKRQTQSLEKQQQARESGAQRSAASSWGSKSWGGGFSGHSGGEGGGSKSWGGGSFGGSHSFGGGGSRGGGGRR